MSDDEPSYSRGDVIDGRYRIERLLGRGMSEVYEVIDEAIRERRALKILPTREQNDPGHRLRLFREAEGTRRIDHPNIVHICSVASKDAAAPYFVMELLRGETMREYLERGGFLFCDSFFGEGSWESYAESLRRVFPDRDIVDLKDEEVVFHVAFELKQMTKVSIPHISQAFGGGFGLGGTPHWRGVFDDTGRLMVLIAHNNDVGDGWQWADDPRYPADEANRALRIGSNIAIRSK